MLIAAAVAATLSYLPAGAQAASSPDDLAQIRQQLQSLIQRVDKLEQENTALKSENENLKAQDDYLKAETKGLRKDAATASADIAKVKGADWAGRVTVKGDMRYRHEEISDDTLSGTQQTADRARDRVRARIAIEAKATDNIMVGVGMTTTEGGDPRSGNKSLTGTFNKKSLDLDLAYFDWKFASWGDLIGGKMKQPFFKPGGSTFFWDNDITPEGLAVTFDRGIWFGSAYGYWVTEISGAENTRTADTMLFGGQVGARIPVGTGTLTVAGNYYDLAAGQGRSPFFNANSNGNTTVVVGGNPVLLNDYRVAQLSGQFDTTLASWPLQIWADVAQNQAVDDLDTAWAAGVLFGKASNPKSWEFGFAYESLEKDALFGQLVDSDFGGGFTDVKGWVLRGAYAPVRNWTLNATYFINERNVDVANPAGQTGVDYNRLQLDFNVKF
ncbi:MAG TPA: putative porin [Steroidobacteraceae bacterium]